MPVHGVVPRWSTFHGGGFVFGNPDSQDAVYRALAKELDAVVVSEDYGSRPEHRFPAAVDDAHAATVWVAANAGTPGHRCAPYLIAVGGDSAGGNLAAVIAMRCRDAGGTALA